jgi:hypothetical protein
VQFGTSCYVAESLRCVALSVMSYIAYCVAVMMLCVICMVLYGMVWYDNEQTVCPSWGKGSATIFRV